MSEPELVDVDDPGAALPAEADAREESPGLLIAGAALAATCMVPILAWAAHLEDESSNWLVFGVAVLMVVGVGLLLRAAGLAHGLGLALLAGPFQFAVSLVGVAALVDVPGRTTVALLASVPGVVLGALAAVVLVRWCGTPATSTMLGGLVGVIVGVFALTFGPAAFDRLLTAEDDARTVAELESTHLNPYLPEFDGYSASFYATIESGEEVTGYSLTFREEGGASVALSETFSVDVEESTESEDKCSLEYATCEERDGYLVVLSGPGGRVTEVQRSTSTALMTVSISGDTPPVDEVGEALADADITTWREVVSAG